MRPGYKPLGVIGAAIAASLLLSPTFSVPAAARGQAAATSTTNEEKCKKDAGEKEYTEEIERLNKLAERYDKGEFAESYIDTITYLMVRCLSERGDQQKLADITEVVIEVIEEAEPKEFRKYAPYIYDALSKNKMENGDKEEARSVLNQGYKVAIRKGVPTAAVAIMTSLIQQHSSDKQSRQVIRLGEETYQLAKDQNIESSPEWERSGYYLFSMVAYAYFQEKRYTDTLKWRRLAAEEVKNRSKKRGRITERDIEDMAYQMLSIASSYGFLQKPSEGLKEIEELEHWMGGNCESRLPLINSSINPKTEWCHSLKAWLYSTRAGQNWGVDYKNAISDYRRALSYTQQEKDKQFTALTALADALYSSQKRENIKEALSLYEKALDLLSEEKEKGSKRYITTTLSAAFSLNELDKYDSAITLIQEAIRLTEEKFSDDKELITELKGGLATVLYNKNGVTQDSAKFAENELTLAQQAKKASGNPDLYLSDRLLMLSAVRLDEGKFLEAIELAKESVKEKTLVLRGRLSRLATDNREEFTEYALGDLEAIYSYAHLLPEATELAFFARLNLHGLIEEVARRQAEASRRLSRSQKSLLNEIEDINQKLSRIGLSKEKERSLKESKKEKERLLYSEFSLDKPFYIENSTIARALGEKEALVEIKKYRKWDRSLPRSQRWGAYEYQIYILDSRGRITLVRLGDAERIEAQIAKALSSSQPQSANGQLVDPEKAVRNWASVIKPVTDNLNGYRKVYLSPDGELHKVPWNAFELLQSEQNKTSLESIEILTTGRDLISSNSPSSPPSAAVVVANPAFNDSPTQLRETSSTQRSSQRSGLLEQEVWSQLPYTKKEGKQVSEQVGGILLTGKDASSGNVRSVNSPSTLHIATHGFFFDPGSEKNPMVASGLVFAGANINLNQGGEDPFLTSLEVSSMNLQGTRLVVLSACSTGDGLIKNGEGVYGLRRALKVAGAQYSLLSLWKVDDAATAAFMIEFYEMISRGVNPVLSLHQTQQKFFNSPIPAWRHPYYWAAWQLVSTPN